MNWRHCGSPLHSPLVNLGSSPRSNAYPIEKTLKAPGKSFPLQVLVCEHCGLVPTEYIRDWGGGIVTAVPRLESEA